jgi:hypothetical protein
MDCILSQAVGLQQPNAARSIASRGSCPEYVVQKIFQLRAHLCSAPVGGLHKAALVGRQADLPRSAGLEAQLRGHR